MKVCYNTQKHAVPVFFVFIVNFEQVNISWVFNLFLANVSRLYPLNISENQRDFPMFSEGIESKSKSSIIKSTIRLN